jgi:hypothetical protein
MPTPAFVSVTKGQAVVIATNVTQGQVHKISPNRTGIFLSTYVPTGDPAPVEADFRGGRIFINSDTEFINANEAIDVYLWLQGDEDGEVRIDV